MAAVARPPDVAPACQQGYLQLSDALAEAERALRGLACPAVRKSTADLEALRAVEARLRALQAEVGRRLYAGGGPHRGGAAEPPAGGASPSHARGAAPTPAAPRSPLFRQPGAEGGGAEAVRRRMSMPPELPSEAKERGRTLDGPDALEEWYTDPWAVGGPGGAEALAAVGVGPRRPGSTSPSMRRTSAELFSMEHDTDLDTEVDDGGASRSRDLGHVEDLANESDRANDPHWQYGRCVCQKIVALSPLGSSAFEQMLVVLMTVFELTEQQRERALAARRKHVSRSRGGWSQLFSVPEGAG